MIFVSLQRFVFTASCPIKSPSLSFEDIESYLHTSLLKILWNILDLWDTRIIEQNVELIFWIKSIVNCRSIWDKISIWITQIFSLFNYRYLLITSLIKAVGNFFLLSIKADTCYDQQKKVFLLLQNW